MKSNTSKNNEKVPTRRLVSLRSLAIELDAHRTSVRRWLTDSNIHPIALSECRRGAIRYLRSEVDKWLIGRDRCD